MKIVHVPFCFRTKFTFPYSIYYGNLLCIADSMADIGQIGINNGKIVENNGVDLGVFRPFRHHHRRLYDDDQVVLLIQGVLMALESNYY